MLWAILAALVVIILLLMGHSGSDIARGTAKTAGWGMLVVLVVVVVGAFWLYTA